MPVGKPPIRCLFFNLYPPRFISRSSVRRPGSALAFKIDGLSFRQRPKPFAQNRREADPQVITALAANDAVAFSVVESHDRPSLSLAHSMSLWSAITPRWAIFLSVSSLRPTGGRRWHTICFPSLVG